MTRYIYLPVVTENLKVMAKKMGLPSANLLSNPFDSGRGKGIARFFHGCLSKLTVRDELLLMSHGWTTGSNKLGDDRDDGSVKHYTPAELAVVLDKEGLSKTFIDLKLLVCGSGNSPPGSTPYGQRLREAMQALGYANVIVTGYTGDVSVIDGAPKVLRNGVTGGMYYPATDAESFNVYG